MKTTLKIAKTELAMLFYSPIAWFLLVVFMFQCGLAYTSILEASLTTQDIGGRNLRFLAFLTAKIFSPPVGIWGVMARQLYLYLPLLTMGLMSRETSSGTIKLLYSSPVKVREIIFGKFIAMMVYNLLLVLILLMIAVSGIFNIRSADTGLLFSGLLGIYLLLGAYAAVGLFMSCLTSYQVVAALSTLVLLGLLGLIGGMWQDIDFVRDLTYFLSIRGRAEHMMLGLITTKDILYFLVIMYMFIGFSIYKLQSDRESRSGWVKGMRYFVIVLSALALGYITARPGLIGYYDATATKSRTLTVGAQKILKEMGNEPLEVTSYINLMDNLYWYGVPSQRNVDMARWEPYLRFKPDIRFKYVYYYDSTDQNLFKYNPGATLDSLAMRYAKTSKVDFDRFLKPEQIRKIIDLRPEMDRYVMQLRYKGKTTFLRLFNDSRIFPGEAETSAALKRLMQATMPRIAFVEGELERSIDKVGDRHYKVLTDDITFRHSLVNQGFDVVTVQLDQQDIPAGITALVIADPKVGFDSVALGKIRRYIAAGGNLMIAGEPGSQALLNPLLQPMGVRLMDGMLVQESRDYSPDLVLPYLTPTAVGFRRSLEDAADDSIPVSMPNATALGYDSGGVYTIRPLLMTDGRVSWLKKKKLDLDMIENSESPYGGAVAASAAAGEHSRTTGVVRPVDTGRAVHRVAVELTPAQKKTADSIRAVVKAIMSGPGSVDGKKNQIRELIARLRGSYPIHVRVVGDDGREVRLGAGGQPERPAAGRISEAGGNSGSALGFAAVRGNGAVQPAGRGADANTLAFNAAEGDVRGALPTALSLSRKVNGREQRIVVVGDADFLCNAELRRSNVKHCNFEFSTAIFSWFANGEFPVDGYRPKSPDTRLAVTDSGLTTLKILFIGVFPGVLLIIGTVLLVRRKRK